MPVLTPSINITAAANASMELFCVATVGPAVTKLAAPMGVGDTTLTLETPAAVPAGVNVVIGAESIQVQSVAAGVHTVNRARLSTVAAIHPIDAPVAIQLSDNPTALVKRLVKDALRQIQAQYPSGQVLTKKAAAQTALAAVETELDTAVT